MRTGRVVLGLALVCACGPRTADSAATTTSARIDEPAALPASVAQASALERSNDFAEAAALLETDCAAGSGEACRHLSRFVRGGVGIERNTVRALELEQRACDQGDGVACATLAERYWTADTVYADEKKAIAGYLKSVPLLEKACDAKRVEACARLGVVFTNGWGVQANLTRAEAANHKAADLFKSACDVGDGDACGSLARAHARGRGVEKNPAASKSLFEKGCSAGSASACHELGLLADKDSSQKAKTAGRELELLEKPCEKGSHTACVRMALAAAQLLGPVGAEPYHRKACDGGSSHSCRELARAKDGGKDSAALKKRALELTTRSCEAGDGVECGLLGLAYIKGDVTASDAKKARLFLERGCTLADSASCLGLGDQLTEGRGGMAKDAAAARAAYEKACRLGKVQGCEKSTKK